ncbi:MULTISPECIES: hypothetical protein [Bacillus cereus group]|uniref:Uncharacterized protein n=3 Tax=Bacillus thuringiensis TaxID=1428 RepID=A0AAP4Q7D3_BACTU|nr:MULTISPECIES: hypothetical protein [Bacillus cereus group]MDA2520143.1 hypothetical protein [Bacillus cereus]AGG05546.1 hypothetical protein H175_328p214 [Bacillus thuringiensis serovar thuringiensis str. IS5056]ARP61258.1 hypothetical protein CAB88_30005 [Bacillus thuringiensis]EEM31673.1 hypothetical protein bthur0003_58540 [Bacillus thuringiensis serovar thuringiensis str. T01001]EEM62866.1 hypothetical protein bthur0008_55140 [Bacillus thuringiensis serovar berliner ATCC 10792]
MSSEQEEIVIPILDLDKFVFSPPGPMGWELSEYEQQKNIVLNESSVLENLAIIKEVELEELPKIGLLDLEEKLPQKTTMIDEVQDKEIQDVIELEEQSEELNEIVLTQIEKPKIKVTIITPDHPLKGPWVSKLVNNAK